MKPMTKRMLSYVVSAFLVLAILSAVVGFGFLAWATPTAADSGPGSEPLRVIPHRVTWSSDYTVSRSFVGRVEARRSSELGFEIGGMVAEVLVEEGDLIKVDQVIARLNTDRLQASLAESLAARDQAQAEFELAKTTRDRTLDSASRGAASQQEIDNAEQAYATTSAALQRALASLASVEVDIDKATITSPFAAVVSARLVDEGRVIGQGTTVVRLLERRDPQVRVGVGGDLIDRVSQGQPFDVAIRNQTVNGVVSAVLPTREARARGVDVLIRLDAELDGIRQGDLARVVIPRQIESDGFWVPTRSLTEGVRGLWSVYLIVDSQAEASTESVLKRVDVEVLHTQGDRVYVRGAIEDGASIVAEGLQRVAPGMSVRVVASGQQNAAELESQRE